MKKSEAEILLGKHLEELGLSYVQEYRFHAERKWKFDFVLVDYRIGIEVDGYFKGRHGAGWGSDNEKQNNAIMLGWRVLRFSTKEVGNGNAKAFIQGWLSPESKET